jgi:hypothetical protein
MQFTIRVEWQQDDGCLASSSVATINLEACQSAADVGLKLAEGKRILNRMEQIVMDEQLRRYCEEKRTCSVCGRRRHLKDNRARKFYTVFGKLSVNAPRFDGRCGCGVGRIVSPLSELLSKRLSPELCDLQIKLAAQLPYRKASAILRDLLPDTGGFSHETTRNRTLAVGKRIEQELCDEIDAPRPIVEPAAHMVVGIDGAFVNAVRTKAGQRHQFEILTGRIETTHRGGETFAVVRDLDRAKQKVQAVLRRCGRDAKKTELTILSDGEDGLRGVVGWFGKTCRHRLDWFHISRRIERIRRDFLYLPSDEDADFGKGFASHCADLDSMKWMLWNDGIEMADIGMTTVHIGLFQHALACSSDNRQPFIRIEEKLRELRSYLYANRESVASYAETFRNKERVSTAHVESTVNQLINWRMCKKHQMAWSRTGAQYLLHVKAVAINRKLDRYTGHQPRPLSMAA